MKRPEHNVSTNFGTQRRVPWLKTFRRPIFGWVQLMVVCWMILQPLANLTAVYVPDSNGNPYWVLQYTGNTEPGSGPDWNTDSEGNPNWRSDFESAVLSGGIAWWGGSNNYVDGVCTSYPPQYHGNGIYDSDMDGIPDDLDLYPGDSTNHTIYWSGGTFRVNDVDYVFPAGYFPGYGVNQSDWDSDWDGIPDGVDPYPGDSSNGNQPYFWWEGGTFQINNGASYFSSQYYFGSSSDSDMDGLPDGVDPYPSDANNGNYSNQTYDWLGGIYTISAGEIFFPPATYPGTWADMDGDGIPDPADPYPWDSTNNTVWWGGGVFRIDGQEVTAAGQWHRADAGDADTDGLPDDLDAYQNDPSNNSLWWDGGTFWIYGVQTTFYPQFYKGPVADVDGDQIPDVLDPYATDGSNGTSWWPGGTFLVNGSYSSYAGQYFAGSAYDSDLDGIPDALDPYANDPWNNTYFTWNGGTYNINGMAVDFSPNSYGGFWSDFDDDGIPDVCDPWPEDNYNNSAWWAGGTYLVAGVYVDYSSGPIPADQSGDADGDGMPDAVDPYLNDSSNFSFYWGGGNYWINNSTMTFGSRWYASTGGDFDGDGIPDGIDPYPEDAGNQNTLMAFWWDGGAFMIDGTSVTFNPGFFIGSSFVDADGDNIPNGPDPYPNDTQNGNGTIDPGFYWAGGTFRVNDASQNFSEGTYYGSSGDRDTDGIPDGADPYPDDPNNQNSPEIYYWSGGTFWIAGEDVTFTGGYIPGNGADSDGDGIPNTVDPCPNDAGNTAGKIWLNMMLQIPIDGQVALYYGWFGVTSTNDTDYDGLPDEIDPYLASPANNSGYWDGTYQEPDGPDADHDGIPDAIDQEPYRARVDFGPYTTGAYYRLNGPDADHDWIPDAVDPSPNDPLNGKYFLWPEAEITLLINNQPQVFSPIYYGGAFADADGDGIPDRADPYPTEAYNRNDTDHDGIPDSIEAQYGLNPNDATDAERVRSDGLTQLQAYLNGLPLDATLIDLALDSDGDGMKDVYEIINGLLRYDRSDAVAAPLGDFVFNFEKAQGNVLAATAISNRAHYLALTGHYPDGLMDDLGKDVAENDWDGDGVSNIDEVRWFLTDPRNASSMPTLSQLTLALLEGKASLTTRANFLWATNPLGIPAAGDVPSGPPGPPSPAENNLLDGQLPPPSTGGDPGGGQFGFSCNCPGKGQGCVCQRAGECEAGGQLTDCTKPQCTCGCGQYGCNCNSSLCPCGCAECVTRCGCGLMEPFECGCGCGERCCYCGGNQKLCKGWVGGQPPNDPQPQPPDRRDYILPYDEAAGPKYRKIALNGRPLADEKPQGTAESDQEKEETFIDALTLTLRHSVTDLFIPIPGSDLPLTARRSTTSTIWEMESGLRPHERPDRPFGAGWTSSLAPTAEFVEAPGQPMTLYITDHNGTSHRFARWDDEGGTHFVPWPTSAAENGDQLTQYVGDALGGVFSMRYGTRVTFVPSGKELEFAVDRRNGGATEKHTYLRATTVDDRVGNSLSYTYSFDSLTPDAITPVGAPDQAIYIRHNADGLVTGIWEPNGAKTEFSYGDLVMGLTPMPCPVPVLTRVRGADGTVTRYNYEVAMDEINEGERGAKYHVNLSTIHDQLGRVYQFGYGVDGSKVDYRDTAEFKGDYVKTGVPRNVAWVMLPDGAVAQFFNQSHVALAYTGVDDLQPRLLGGSVRQTWVEDALGHPTIYRWSNGGVWLAHGLAQDGGDQRKVPKVVYYTGLTIDYGAEVGTEAYAFDLDAGLAVSSARDLSGNLTQFGYEEPWLAPSGYRGVFTGMNGHYGDPTRQVDELGQIKLFEYDGGSRIMKKVTDEAGRTTTYELDAKARRTKATIGNAAGVIEQVTDFTYGSTAFPGVVTSRKVEFFGAGPAGASDLVTNYELDTAGRVAWTIVDPAGLHLATHTVYDVNGNALSVTDAKGRTTNFSYDRRNRLVGVTYADLTTMAIAYDGRGNKARETDEKGNVTTYSYDAMNRLVEQRRSMGAGTGDLISRFGYNAVGSRLWAADPNGHSVQTEYDVLQRPKKQIDANNQATLLEYGVNSGGRAFDSSGFKPTKVTDARGFVTTAENDVLYRTTATHSVYGTSGSTPLVSTTGATYDAVGNAITTTDPLGRVTTKAYDALNRVRKVTYQDGKTNEAVYTSSGLRWKAIDELGRTLETRYDRAGRPVKAFSPTLADGSQAITETVYDEVGNTVSTIDPLGRRTDITYNARNRNVRVEGPAVLDAISGQTVRPMTDTVYDAVGNVTATIDPRGGVTTSEYDKANRKVKIKSPAVPVAGEAALVQLETTMVYDGVGNVLTVTDPQGRTTTNTYDNTNRLLTTTDGAGITVTNQYDVVGNLTAVIDGKNQRTEFTYDGLKRNLTVKSHLGQTTQFLYDGVNKYRRIDADGVVTNYGYDNRHRLQTVEYPTQPLNDRIYIYDPAGRLLWVVEPGKVGKANVGYTYDALNRVVTEKSQDVTHTYTYDLAGNRLTTVYGGTSRELVSTYDALNRLQTVTESPTVGGGRVTTYQYDLNGNLVMKILPNRDSISTSYDALNRATGSSGYTAEYATMLYDYAQTRDKVGNLVGITEQTASLPARTAAMTYDGVDRLLSETETVAGVAKTTSFTYDLANNRATRTKTDGIGGASTATYHYDGNNRMTDWREGTKVIAFDYNNAGSRIWRKENGVTNATYSYDPEQRLTGLIQDGTTYAYTYDYRTRRVERTEGGTSTKVIFGGGTSVQEREGANTTVEYVRGSDWGGGVGGILYTLRSGAPSFIHYDSRGDVTTKTDATGAITYQAAYEAFGKRTAEQGATADRQKANTKEEDPTGLLNEGMRYRDLETGTFTTADPAGFVDGPNLYAYVRQNPWTMFDPDGLAGARRAETEPEPAPIRGHLSIGGGWFRSPFGTEYRPTGGGIVWRDQETGRFRFTPRLSASQNSPITITVEQVDRWEAKFGQYREVRATPSADRSATEALRDKLAAELRMTDHFRRLEQGEAAKNDALRDIRRSGLDVDPKTGEYRGGEGVVYLVPGTGTPSGRPYVGTADNLEKRTENATDGRDRTQAVEIGRYPVGNIPVRKEAEQEGIDQNGGISNLDNKRNEIRKPDKE